MSTGIQNTSAIFNVKVKAGNYYVGNITIPVIVSKQPGDLISAGNSSSDQMTTAQQNSSFDVIAMPNPSQGRFNLKIFSSNKYEKINVRVTDATGRLIESKTNLNARENITLGEHYLAGVYLVEITQGKNKKVMKVIKQ